MIGWPIFERIPLFGGLAVSPHGIFAALGVVVGAEVLRRRATSWGLGTDVDDVGDAVWRLLTPVLLAAIVGARAFYVFRRPGDFADQPMLALAAWEGGLTLLGGVAAGVATGVVVMRRRGFDVRRVLDMAAPGLAAGIAIGRVGDLVIGDHIGAPAVGGRLAWSCTGNYWNRAENALDPRPPLPYPESGAPTAGCFDVPVVQTAALDLLAAGVALVGVVLVARWVTRRPGTGLDAAAFVVLYGLGRLVFDTLRQDERISGLTASQWTAVAAIASVVAWMAARRPWERPVPTDHAPGGRS